MKKIWVVLIILSLVIFVSFIVVLIKSKKVVFTKDNIKSMHFSYSTGNMIYSNVRYKLEYKNNKYVANIKPNNIPDEEEKEIEIDENTLQKIIDVLNKYKVYNWNNFHKSDKRVLDGNSFSFYLKTKDKKDIDASGYMKWPKNYYNVREELDNIFNELYN